LGIYNITEYGHSTIQIRTNQPAGRIPLIGGIIGALIIGALIGTLIIRRLRILSIITI